MFRLEDNEAVDVENDDYQRTKRSDASCPMLSPRHPREALRDGLEAAKLSVTEAAWRLGCTRQALSRLSNGKAGVSLAMALELDRIGRGNASFWMGLQAAYELAQEPRRQAA